MSLIQKLTLRNLDKFADHGLLVMRLGLGATFIAHGWPKLVGGPEKWTKVGGAMSSLGIDFAPQFWGFMAAITEVGGGALLILGLLTRPALLGLIFTMFVATMMHITKDHGFVKISHSLELGIAFAGMFLLGPGRFSLDHKLGNTDNTDDG